MDNTFELYSSSFSFWASTASCLCIMYTHTDTDCPCVFYKRDYRAAVWHLHPLVTQMQLWRGLIHTCTYLLSSTFKYLRHLGCRTDEFPMLSWHLTHWSPACICIIVLKMVFEWNYDLLMVSSGKCYAYMMDKWFPPSTWAGVWIATASPVLKPFHISFIILQC